MLMPFVCFMGLPAVRRLLSLLMAAFIKVKKCMKHLKCFEYKRKSKKVYFCRVNCKEVDLCSMF